MTENRSACTAATAEETPALNKAGTDHSMGMYMTLTIAWWCKWGGPGVASGASPGLLGRGEGWLQQGTPVSDDGEQSQEARRYARDHATAERVPQ